MRAGGGVAGAILSVLFRAVFVLAVSAAFASATGIAGEKLDMSFIQGGAGVNPDVWTALNGSYAPGRYLVDLSLNVMNAILAFYQKRIHIKNEKYKIEIGWLL